MKTNTILIVLGALVIIALAAFLLTQPKETATLLDEPSAINLQESSDASMTTTETTMPVEPTTTIVEPTVVEPAITPELPVSGVKPE